MPAHGDEGQDIGSVARNWWRSLQPDGKRPGDRAALAHLRRSSSTDALAQEATLVLFRALGYTHHSKLPRVATLASVLAHVRDDDPARPFARAIGRTSFDKDDAPLKLLRFQRLIDARGEDEIHRGFRRAIDIVRGAANVADLARIILNYDSEERRRRFTFDYYGAFLANQTTPSIAT